LFIGGHPAIDFVNTRFAPRGQEVEIILDGDSLLDWLTRAGLLTGAAAAGLKRNLGAQRLGALATQVRELRDWASGWLSRWSHEPGADYSRELRRLNGFLRKRTYHREVISNESPWRLLDRAVIEGPEDILALIATQIALLVTDEDPALLKHCAGKECTLWFLDRTKGRRRLFCSASACGNRAKVAAFRARQADT
jgi:predicted RNA-binding Zn ribbon-like protein